MVKMSLSISVVVYVLFLIGQAVHSQPQGNVYTAIAHMEPLVGIEERLVDLARDYLDKERRKLGELRQFAKSVEEAMELSKDEPLKYLGNPVNSYLIIKRFTSGWRELASRLEVDDSKIDAMKAVLKANEHHLPTHNIDLLGAIASIFRLQDTYDISAREISDGKIKDISRSAHQMTAEDCMNIANYAHKTARYIRMEEWAKEAEQIILDPSLVDRVGNVSKLAIYETIGWTSYLSNNLEEAMKYTNLVLEIDPKNEAALKNEEFYRFYEKENVEKWLTEEQWDYKEAQKYLENYKIGTFVELCKGKKKRVNKIKRGLDPVNSLAIRNEMIYRWYLINKVECTEPEVKWMGTSKEVYRQFTELDYVRACRNPNPKVLMIKDPSKLVCFYKNDHPILRLKPVRTTRVHDNPDVFIFHDLVNDKEIEKLKKLATPYLQQAQVVNPDTPKVNNEGDPAIIEANYRIAKTMFLMDVFPEVQQIQRKLDVKFEAVTGLSTVTAEQLQINNYGLGGQYEFHIDHGDEGTFIAQHEHGNRIATLLCYLSDVERGGETVFTKLGLSVSPKKGDAVFWYNLHRNGSGNPNTEHASCPVVSGSKWVANKWFHLHDNEFRRKCSLNKND